MIKLIMAAIAALGLAISPTVASPLELPPLDHVLMIGYVHGTGGASATVTRHDNCGTPQARTTLLTARHVAVSLRTGKEDAMELVPYDVPVTLVRTSARYDVAIITVPRCFGTPIEIWKRTPDFPFKTFILGHPKGRLMLADGYAVKNEIVNEMPISNGPYILSSAPSRAGLSGGALIYKGALMGLVVGSHPDFPHISVAIPPEHLWEFFNNDQPHT